MSKRKPARPRKALSASKVRSKATRGGQHKGRANSKQARVLALLREPNGAKLGGSCNFMLAPCRLTRHFLMHVHHICLILVH
jgi:hypothetical protein